MVILTVAASIAARGKRESEVVEQDKQLACRGLVVDAAASLLGPESVDPRLCGAGTLLVQMLEDAVRDVRFHVGRVADIVVVFGSVR